MLFEMFNCRSKPSWIRSINGSGAHLWKSLGRNQYFSVMRWPSPGTTAAVVVSIVYVLISLLWLFCLSLGSHGNVMPHVSFSGWESWKRSASSAARRPHYEWTSINANSICWKIKQSAIVEARAGTALGHSVCILKSVVDLESFYS